MTTPLHRTAALTDTTLRAADEAGLELRGITFTHPGAVEATLAEVDLAVASGEMLAVVGPSGSGKTSTLRVTAGLVLPEQGEVFVGGVNLSSRAPERRGMSMLFQRPLLFPHLNVLDNVGFADRVTGQSRRRARARAADYLGLVHLAHLARRGTGTLSGGQEQRVALARALAAEPRVLLLDEPFSSLDAGVRAAMHELLGEVRAVLAPTTVIVTHDLDEAALADRVAVLVGGRVHQVDSVAELYRRPATREVARVLGGFAEVEGHLDEHGHHSPFGVLPWPPPSAALTGHEPPLGAATVLVRRESLRTTSTHDAAAVFVGVVVAVRQRGLRHSVVLEPEAGHRFGRPPRVEVEHPAMSVPTHGDRVGVALTGLPYSILPAAPA